MPGVERIVAEMRRNPAGVRFTDLTKVCRHYFGEPRPRGTAHQVFRTPWRGDPRINVQDRLHAARRMTPPTPRAPRLAD
jgi:hypothetical protein